VLLGQGVVLLAVTALVSVPQPPSPPGVLPADSSYLAWLEERSMLRQAGDEARKVSGHPVQWRHPYGKPQPLRAVRHASVWLLDYPGSVIPRPGQSVIATWADPGLWDALRELGVDLLHTGPLNRAGGVRGREFTPTRDGWFDRVSLDLDPALGTDDEYARMVAVASGHKASVAGDLVPLHTGIGPDFHLATRSYKDYPGMYTMVEIPRADWGLLPEVKSPWQPGHVPKPAAEQLARKGYIPGLINSNDASPEAKSWSGWSATAAVVGADGKARRWVFLHYFKPTQPALNWLDPSYAARRAVAGDVVRTVLGRKTRVVRLDAVPFLGIEPTPGEPGKTEHFKHPLSVVGTNDVAMLVRKLGGWSFHELNVPLEDLKKFTANGPDLSYDFVTRAQCLHALLSGDAGPLRLSFRWMLEAGAQPVGFVHDLQNHDEITYQLVEPEHRKDRVLAVGGRKLTGKELREGMLALMRKKVAGEAAPYNRLYRPEKDGVATTFAGFVAPALGIDPYEATPEDVKRIARGHLLLAAANALQPGVFSLSSWDVVGALPVSGPEVERRAADGDQRWVNRGGVDLAGANPKAEASAFGLPRARALYGSLPAQLKDADSFASRLRAMLAARRTYRVAEGELLAVPEPKTAGVCVLVLKLPDHPAAVTVLNFGREEVEEEIALGELLKGAGPPAGGWVDIVSGAAAGTSSEAGRLLVRLPALAGMTLVPDKPAP
jgi:maltose alpha-D-glucosyltransferase/alpha-amylase